MDKDPHTDEQIRQILTHANIAVIGISKNPDKAAHYVPKYLSENGFNIIPVNPTADQILGKKCHPDIGKVDSEIDIVDIFRPSEQTPEIVREAIKKRPKVIWLQEGIHNAEAVKMAKDAGIDIVFNRCMLAEHRRLLA